MRGACFGGRVVYDSSHATLIRASGPGPCMTQPKSYTKLPMLHSIRGMDIDDGNCALKLLVMPQG